MKEYSKFVKNNSDSEQSDIVTITVFIADKVCHFVTYWHVFLQAYEITVHLPLY